MVVVAAEELDIMVKIEILSLIHICGVEHRAELVRELDGVKWYNDSIGTSPTRTARGTLSLYDRKIIPVSYTHLDGDFFHGFYLDCFACSRSL